MKTYVPKANDLDHKVYLVDASGKTLGRLATKVAGLLLGKAKPEFTYDQWCGDQVVVVNASKIHVTGNKKEQKVYTHYTGYPGGLRSKTLEDMLDSKPEDVLMLAVKRMLPKNKLGRSILKHLRVYAGAEHKQQAQKPVELTI